MKTTLRIARLELKLLFYSPIAWLVLIIFTVKDGIDFSSILHDWAGAAHSGYKLANVTEGIYNPVQGFFKSVQEDLMLFIPFLTMGLMSREFSSGFTQVPAVKKSTYALPGVRTTRTCG